MIWPMCRDGVQRWCTASQVVQRVAQLIQKVPMPYCEGFGGRAILHARPTPPHTGTAAIFDAPPGM